MSLGLGAGPVVGTDYLSHDPRYAYGQLLAELQGPAESVGYRLRSAASDRGAGSACNPAGRFERPLRAPRRRYRQRTVDEFGKLLSSSGWAIQSMRPLNGSALAILKA